MSKPAEEIFGIERLMKAEGWETGTSIDAQPERQVLTVYRKEQIDLLASQGQLLAAIQRQSDITYAVFIEGKGAFGYAVSESYITACVKGDARNDTLSRLTKSTDSDIDGVYELIRTMSQSWYELDGIHFPRANIFYTLPAEIKTQSTSNKPKHRKTLFREKKHGIEHRVIYDPNEGLAALEASVKSEAGVLVVSFQQRLDAKGRGILALLQDKKAWTELRERYRVAEVLRWQ